MTSATYCYILVMGLAMVTGCKQSGTGKTNLPVKDTATIQVNTGTVNTQQVNETDSVGEKVTELIPNLPEIQQLGGYIQKQSNGTHTLKVWVSRTPGQNDNEHYIVNAGEDSEVRLATRYIFYVHQQSFEIRYYDTVNDTLVSIADWRQQIKKELQQ